MRHKRLLAAALLWPGMAAAMTVEGPAAKVDKAPAGLREEVSAPVPVPVGILDGMFVLGVDYTAQKRDEGSLSVLGLSAYFLPHVKEGAPKVFVEAGRYGHPAFAHDARPMLEATVGAFASGPDLPAWTRWAPNDETTVQVAVQVRSFPGFREVYPDLRYRLDKASGWFVDLEAPAKALVGFAAPRLAWSVYGGGRWDPEAYPVAQVGWLDGWTETFLVGVSHQLAGPLSLALEAGAQAETARLVNEHGKSVAHLQTAHEPWARVALVTWIQTP